MRADEAVAIVDVRAASADRESSRARFVAALDGHAGVSALAGEGGVALAGVAADADDSAAASALAEARDGFGALECGRARPAAEEALGLLAGRQAAGLDERARLTAAWTYLLLCADRDGDAPVARAAADRLRGFGGSTAVPADVWAKYPEIDAATDRDIVELTVAAPIGATVAIDHVVVGAAPVKRFVSAGKHLVAVAAGTVRGATLTTVFGTPLTVEVPVGDRAGSWRDVAGRVAAWQGATPPGASELGELMTRAGVRFAVVLGAGGKAELWVRGPRDRGARLALEGTLAEPGPLAAAVAARVAAWTDGGPDPDVPLLTEADAPLRESPASREPTRWWVYAVIGGAVAAGAVTIYALDAGQDRQRLELTF